MKPKDFDADHFARNLKESADQAFDGAEFILKRNRMGVSLFFAMPLCKERWLSLFAKTRGKCRRGEEI
jgi:hypothetical protein